MSKQHGLIRQGRGRTAGRQDEDVPRRIFNILPTRLSTVPGTVHLDAMVNDYACVQYKNKKHVFENTRWQLSTIVLVSSVRLLIQLHIQVSSFASKLHA